VESVSKLCNGIAANTQRLGEMVMRDPILATEFDKRRLPRLAVDGRSVGAKLRLDALRSLEADVHELFVFAGYRHNAAVKALATQLGITLLFRPSFSPNLNLIKRL